MHPVSRFLYKAATQDRRNTLENNHTRLEAANWQTWVKSGLKTSFVCLPEHCHEMFKIFHSTFMLPLCKIYVKYHKSVFMTSLEKLGDLATLSSHFLVAPINYRLSSPFLPQLDPDRCLPSAKIRINSYLSCAYTIVYFRAELREK